LAKIVGSLIHKGLLYTGEYGISLESCHHVQVIISVWSTDIFHKILKVVLKSAKHPVSCWMFMQLFFKWCHLFTFGWTNWVQILIYWV